MYFKWENNIFFDMKKKIIILILSIGISIKAFI